MKHTVALDIWYFFQSSDRAAPMALVWNDSHIKKFWLYKPIENEISLAILHIMICSLLLLLWTSLFPSIIRILLPILMWLMVRWMTGTMVMMMVMRSSFWSSSYPKWCWSEWIIFMWPEVRSYMLFEHLFTLVSIEWVEIIIFSDLYNWKSN